MAGVSLCELAFGMAGVLGFGEIALLSLSSLSAFTDRDAMGRINLAGAWSDISLSRRLMEEVRS